LGLMFGDRGLRLGDAGYRLLLAVRDQELNHDVLRFTGKQRQELFGEVPGAGTNARRALLGVSLSDRQHAGFGS